MTRWLIEALERTDPAERKLWAARCLIASVVAAVANVVLYLVGVIDSKALILVTLVLSWLALTITAADLLMTTDVRGEQDSDTSEITDSCSACGR